jgi:hypothetical protein
VLQHAVVHENRTRDHRSYSQFKEAGKEKDKQGANFMDEGSANDGNAEISIAEWVDTPRSISCSFLRPNDGKKDEMRYTFDVSKCDKLSNVLVRGGGGD